MKAIVNFFKVVLSIFVFILILYILNIILTGYRNSYFNNFVKAELNLYHSTFTRDTDVKYNDILSYKIYSPDYNDAMFYKTIEVKPNTAYKVTCKVKTENVETQSQPSDSGAHISIPTTTEKSASVSGTSDWEEISLYFNSRNRTSVNIAFRLGGVQENCKGTAWFADFKLEQGTEIKDNNWNYACFIFKNIDVNLDEQVKISMTDNEIYNIKENIERFKNSVEDFSNGNIKANCNIIEIDEPITSISYDKENGYYISGDNISNIINKYIEKKDYQHIFAIAKFGEDDTQIPVNDWLGLGSMTYQGIGFSNIRIPGDKSNKVYQFSKYNQFPEEVFIHEFLHDLERISKEAEFETPALHDYEKYGYEIDSRTGLKDWYNDYMENNVQYNGKQIGIVPEVYKMKPVGKENLEFSIEIDFVKEPKNIFEEIVMITTTTANVISTQINATI